MIPLIPFALGIVSGAIAVRLARTVKAKESLVVAREGLQKTRSSLRDATVSSLAAIEHTSARVREKLVEPAAESTPAPKATLATAASKPRNRKPAAVAASAAPAKPKRAPRSRKPAVASPTKEEA
ncbi:MAG: hypothetical protein CGU28_13420 [Candidatus Dactylopiibacterium carminicum]|uniref:DUF5132 domain-containing protein n=1 Tax=Candidatus Dactylopiibacterium carminicum TaxID=857335 RepID=A0A272EP25_9RHOO|nr:hypothetical protein [Candidatus Dactylopiibacterium carminicum]KAF7598220.1 hypothetical protein BGI27_14495 [Candidatus Dactylopiibacterium carminicum]PAS91872.1 MAG: hypothetical protein CGU29_14115 [Candidatus Dactylopiibacterium carminicum]PAS94847.1 MAG: hypothetical protein CGU28_13420 [Candidatus Dactylopiibacterium carminicum]PAS97014.1 MAG: hypothetical protein BSR46_14530 [Candidatus Dactylopiibacterium carminicum]